MQTFEHSDPDNEEFWSSIYGGRPIAILIRHGRWHVYLDHILQHNVVFATGDQAVTWLMQRIDQRIPGRLN